MPRRLSCRSGLLRALVTLLTLACFIAAASNARAATTRTVTTLADSVDPGDNRLSLREAIAASASGDRIDFAIPFAGTLVLTRGELVIGRGLTIIGPGARKVVISGNNASRIFNITAAEPVRISGLTLTRGRAPTEPEFPHAARGGAISNTAPLTLTACALRDSVAQGRDGTGDIPGYGFGGGVFNSGSLTVRDCLVSGNRVANGFGEAGPWSQGDGGGIHSSGPLLVINTTVTENTADNGGGGLMVAGPAGRLALIACTVARNNVIAPKEFQPSGGIHTFGAVSLRSSLVAGNLSAEVLSDLQGTFVSQGHNLIGVRDGAVSPEGGAPWQATDLTGTRAAPFDPVLGPLQNNAGPTDTCALLPGSAALNTGDDALLEPPLNLVTDQRQVARRVGPHLDIGAFERDLAQTGANLTVTTLEDADDGIAGVAHCTLREALAVTNAQDDLNLIRFAPTLSGTMLLEPARGTLRVSQPVHVAGPGARAVRISGAQQVRVFEVTGDGVTLSGLTITLGVVRGTNGGSFGGHAEGGGIRNTGRLTLNSCTISFNNAWGGAASAVQSDGTGGNGLGAGVYNSGALVMVRCTVNGNDARGGDVSSSGIGGGVARGGRALGGGLHNAGSATLTNCTFDGNFARGGVLGGPAEGGALYNAGAAVLTNLTVASNQAGGAGLSKGGGLFSVSRTRVVNSLFALNQAGNMGPDVSGAVESLGTNLVGIADGSSGWVGTDRTGAQSAPLNPRLSGLANNGGPTDTCALLASSPALNQANPGVAPPADQREFQRADAPDIGAFELGGFSFDPPQNVSITPATSLSNLGVQRTFTARYADPNGADDFKDAYFLVNFTAAPKGGLFCYYNARANRLYLRNRANTAWLGGFFPGAANVISEREGSGKLHCAQTTVGRSGTTLTIGWSITPEAPLAGNRSLYLSAQDRTDRAAGWSSLGKWAVSAPPANLSVSPTPISSRVGVARTLAAVYSDANGAGDLRETWITLNGEPKNGGGLQARYDAVADRLYLRHSTSGALLGGSAPGAPTVITDPGGRGSLNCGATSVVRSGTTLTVRWSLTPGANLAGARNIYLRAQDRQGLTTGWDLLGAWTVNP